MIVGCDTKNINRDFWLENLLIRLQLKNHLTRKAEIWTQCGCLGAPGHVTKMLHAENGQKVDDFEAMYLGKYQF